MRADEESFDGRRSILNFAVADLTLPMGSTHLRQARFIRWESL